MSQPGRHPVIYGQRGVGKTSLSNILCDSLVGGMSMRIACDGSDSFETMWNRVLSTAPIDFKVKAFGLSKQEVSERTTLAAYLPVQGGSTTPSDVASVLRMIETWSVVVLDEYDKLCSDKAHSYMADLIKALSDTPCRVSIAIVGVGKNLSDLIGHHPSIERNLVQIELQKMSDAEIQTILASGFEKLEVSSDDDVLKEAVELSNGFPHYAHLLGLNCVKACYKNNSQHLDAALFRIGCDLAVQDSIEKYRDEFSEATATTQFSRYPQILCACAWADHDDRGVFRASDVVDAMKRVFNTRLSIQSVVPALGEFASPARGSVLTKVAVGNRSHYKVRDPMMRPFLRVKTQSVLQIA